jgi:magnesium chelatase subunit D
LSAAPTAWDDAACAAALLAIDPAGLGGMVLRAGAGPVRDRLLERVRALLPPGTPLRKIPLHAGEGRLLGGLDLAATLGAGRPMHERGLLGDAHGGLVVVAMAERMERGTAALVATALDDGEVRLERDGLALRVPARIGAIVLDEGHGDDPRPPSVLTDRLAFHASLDGVPLAAAHDDGHDAQAIVAARARLAGVRVSDDVMTALVAAADALGVASLRAPLLAVKAARASAALAGRDAAEEEDAAIAARLVLAPRATRLPAPPEDAAGEDEAPPDTPPPEEAEAPAPPQAASDAEPQSVPDRPLEDRVLDAAQAAIPPDLLARLQWLDAGGARTLARGRAGPVQRGGRRGRPAGTRRGELRPGARLAVVETLRAAAPWQPLRRAAAPQGEARVQVRRDDFRIARYRSRTRTAVIFAVDASGSAALHRLAEAKGAVELVLAECYVRRDEVALVAFRGTGAEVILPPTRSLARAKRMLAGLPGGGGTPLAAGVDAARMLAESVRRAGDRAVVVVLTDGRANVARDGSGGRPRAEEDAWQAARALRAAGLAAMVIDTSPRPHPLAERLAREMDARYVPLPHADAAAMSRAVAHVAREAGHAPAAA